MQLEIHSSMKQKKITFRTILIFILIIIVLGIGLLFVCQDAYENVKNCFY